MINTLQNQRVHGKVNGFKQFYRFAGKVVDSLRCKMRPNSYLFYEAMPSFTNQHCRDLQAYKHGISLQMQVQMHVWSTANS